MKEKRAKVIAIANQKGGVLKTTSAYNLGYCLAKSGKDTLMVDFDPQSSLTVSTGNEPEDFEYTLCDAFEKRNAVTIDKCIYGLVEHLDFAPNSLDFAALEMEIIGRTAREYLLEKVLQPVISCYDYILIDCPPQLSILTINALTAADGVIIPCKTDYISYRGIDQLCKTVQDIKSLVNPKLEVMGVIPTLFEKGTDDHKKILKFMEENYTVLGIISKAADATKGVYDGLPVAEYKPKSKVSQAYMDIAERILNR